MLPAKERKKLAREEERKGVEPTSLFIFQSFLFIFKFNLFMNRENQKNHRFWLVYPVQWWFHRYFGWPVSGCVGPDDRSVPGPTDWTDRSGPVLRTLFNSHLFHFFCFFEFSRTHSFKFLLVLVLFSFRTSSVSEGLDHVMHFCCSRLPNDKLCHRRQSVLVLHFCCSRLPFHKGYHWKPPSLSLFMVRASSNHPYHYANNESNQVTKI